MGGSGGGGGSRGSMGGGELADEARKRLQNQEVLAQINDYLGELLAAMNDRDAELTRERLDEILDCLGDDVAEVDRLLFGGSVAKHTFVDGLSDADALVVMKDVDSETPSELVSAVATAIRNAGAGEVVDVAAGDIAVTITYADGSQIQVLPACEREGVLRIASEDGSNWREIRPRKFAEKLTQANQRCGGGVVPSIKLAKSVLQQLPEAHRLSGYHLEAIAVDAFEGYTGSTNRYSMLQHLLEHATTAVLRPTGDITGQSVHIDAHLGGANSTSRKSVSASISRIAKRVATAKSAADIKAIFDE